MIGELGKASTSSKYLIKFYPNRTEIPKQLAPYMYHWNNLNKKITKWLMDSYSSSVLTIWLSGLMGQYITIQRSKKSNELGRVVYIEWLNPSGNKSAAIKGLMTIDLYSFKFKPDSLLGPTGFL